MHSRQHECAISVYQTVNEGKRRYHTDAIIVGQSESSYTEVLRKVRAGVSTADHPRNIRGQEDAGRRGATGIGRTEDAARLT